ncbi:hypothetical protein BJ742DRAFT_179333 [Cladochytrium replicatum]|nr:hypothetical protein BJ742DRAFT_179333 [Cladochytrium replicatum]
MLEQSELSPLYLAVHDKRYMAPAGGLTLMVKSSIDKSETFTVTNHATSEVLFHTRRGFKSLVVIEDHLTKQVIGKMNVNVFGGEKNGLDAERHQLYHVETKVEGEWEKEDKTFTAGVKNTLDGLDYEISLKIWHETGKWEYYTNLNGFKKTVALCERIDDKETDNKYSYMITITEGMDMVLVLLLTLLAHGGKSKLKEIATTSFWFLML